MEHLVRFQTTEGREGHHTADSLEDALRFVERLRNSEGTQQARVFRLTEVPIEFRTYYKVELRTESDDVPAPEPHAALAEANGDGDLGDQGRRLFSRS